MVGRIGMWLAAVGLTVGGLAAAGENVSSEAYGRPRKRLLYCGWDQATPRYLREHADEVAAAPYDDVLVSLDAVDDQGEPVHYHHSFSPARRWKQAWFKQNVADLKAVARRGNPSHFIGFWLHTGPRDWDDDAAWDTLANNAAILAWVAKQGGCRGLAMDPEHYGTFFLSYNPDSPDTYARQAAKARKRGAQIMRAIGGEFPDVTILGYWLFSAAWEIGDGVLPGVPAAEEALKKHRYGLYPAFLNGFLDALPPKATLVDGNEFSYTTNDRLQFFRQYHKMRGTGENCLWLVAPENRVKYLRQVQAGFGIYLDAYINPPEDVYYVPPRPGESRMDALARNLADAMAIADGYVWTWAENGRCLDFPPWDQDKHEKLKTAKAGHGKLWEELLPGFTERLNHIRRSGGRLEQGVEIERARLLVERGDVRNLAENADFSALPPVVPTELPPKEEQKRLTPPSYTFWGKPAGFATVVPDGGRDGSPCARVAGVDWGVLGQTVAVKPGQRYYLRMDGKHRGNGGIAFSIEWMGNGKHLPGLLNVTIPFGVPDADGWGTAEGVLEVPDTAQLMFVQILFNGMKKPGDVAWLDDFGIYLLP